jgi:Tol biopolymer transport system component
MRLPLVYSARRRSTGVQALLVALLALAAGPASAQLSLPPDYLWRQLSPAGEPGASVRFLWKMDARGEWVVFVGDVENTGAEAVYSRRRTGGELHRLSPYGPVGAVQSLELSADGRYVIYRGDLATAGLDELWSAPIAGTPAAAVKLNLAVTGAGVTGSTLPAAGGRIGYLAETASGVGFWSVPVAGPAAASVRLDFDLAPDEALYGGLVVSDSRVVLLIYDTGSGVIRLWSAPLSGPAAAGVSLLDATPPDCGAFLVAASPSTNRIAYALTCDTPVGNRTNQLWSVPMTGPASEAVSLAGSFVEGGAIQAFSTSPDGQYLVLLADKLVDERFELWSVPIAGPAGAMVRLNPALVSGGDVSNTFEISPDSTRVAYVADQTSNEVFRAWSVPIAGPSTLAVPLVSGIVAAGADVTNLDFTPDSMSIVFRADLSQDERFDLYLVPADGSAAQDRITNDSSIPGPDRSTGSLWRLHPDGQRVVFTVDEDAPGDQRGLYEQRLAPHYVQDARLNGDPVAGGRISTFQVFPDSAGTIYYSDELADERFHLFTADSRIFGDGFEETTTAAWPDTP